MYNYPDKIDVSSGGSSGGVEIEYDPETGMPIFPEKPKDETGDFEFLSDCRIEPKGSYSLSGTYIYSYMIYIPLSLDPSRLPAKGASIRLNNHKGTIKDRSVVVVDSWPAKLNYVIKT